MILAADNINALNPVVARAVETGDASPVAELAARCVEQGAQWLDINPGPLSRRRAGRMASFVRAVQGVTDARLILDSPRAHVLEAGLAECRDTPVLNALTMEPEKLETILPLAVDTGADLVILLLDERSMCPPDADARMALAVALWQQAVDAGLMHEKLIFDPVAPHISWPGALDQLDACCETIRALYSGELLGRPARTMAGISNLLSGERRRHPARIEHEALIKLAGAGLHIALANVLDKKLMKVFQEVSGGASSQDL